MISKKVYTGNNSTKRFLSDFIIRSDQFARPYVFIYDNTLATDGTEDVLQNPSLPWEYPTNLYKRGSSAAKSEDLVTSDKWQVVDNSILFYLAPPSGSTVWVEVATTSEEFGTTLIAPAVSIAVTAAEVSQAASIVATTKAAEAAASAANALLSKTDIDTKLDAVQSNGNTAQENINIVATDIADVNTIASNMTDVTYFADVYQGAKALVPTLRNDGSALAAGDLYFNTVGNAMFVYDGSVWSETGSAINGVEKSEEFIATGGQTLFTVTSGYDVGFVNVFREGMLLGESEYTADNGSTVTLNVACIAGDIVKVQAFGAFTLADHYTKAEQDVIDGLQDTEIALKAPQATTYTKTEVDTEITNRSFGFKNHIINGGMDVWQRGTSFTSNEYTADRWGLYKASGSMTLTKSDVIPNILGDSRLRLNTTVVHADAQIYQKIEDVRTLQGKTATLSFWVHTIGNFKVEAKHSYGSGGTSQNIFHSQYTTEVVPSTWSKVEMEIDIPELGESDTVGDGSFLQVTLFIGANLGSTYIKNIQLEEGSVATPFEQRPYGLELSLCQRYLPSFDGGAHGFAGTTTSGTASIPFSVPARVAPTSVFFPTGVAVGYFSYTTQAVQAPCTTINFTGISSTGTTRCVVLCTVGSAIFAQNAVPGVPGILFGGGTKLLFGGCEL